MGVIASSAIEITPALQTLEEAPSGERCALLVIGVCRSWTGARLSEFLSRYSLNFQKVQKSRGEDYAVLDFSNNGDRLSAYNFLQECKISDETFIVKPYYEYDPPPMPYATQAEILRFSKLNTQTLLQRLYPFLGATEEERLKNKQRNCANFLKDVYKGQISVTKSGESFPCHTRIDLQVGYDDEGAISVGLNKASRANTTVIQVDESLRLPKKVVEIANAFQEYFKSSMFPPYDKESGTGKWMNVSVRYAATEQTMITIATMGSLPLSEVEKLEESVEGIADSIYWLKGTAEEASIASPHHTICGAQFIVDKIHDLSFTIYPFTIFPYNFEIFMKTIDVIKEHCSVDQQTVLVDTCCGIGVNCLNLAKYVKRTIGIDSQEKNISASMKNAEENKILNAYFVHGQPSTLTDIANNVQSGEKLICILDTTNIGPHNEITCHINSLTKIQTIVYITSAPETLAYELQRTLVDWELYHAELFDSNPMTNEVKLIGFIRSKTI